MNSEHQMQKHSCSLRGSVITNRITYPYKEPEDNKKEKKKEKKRQQRSYFRRQQMMLEAHEHAWVSLGPYSVI